MTAPKSIFSTMRKRGPRKGLIKIKSNCLAAPRGGYCPDDYCPICYEAWRAERVRYFGSEINDLMNLTDIQEAARNE